VYNSLVCGHLGAGSYSEELKRLGPRLVDATVELHKAVGTAFLPR
jgi:hypothetical protein